MNIQLPPGTRDLIDQEALVKRYLETEILEQFKRFGYREVMTPAIEYYQTYHNAFSFLEDGSMYKFFDEKGEILTLRMDMTVPIARLAATKFASASFPLRLCYCANVYKVKKSFAGKRHEVTDCGIELIGEDKSGDLEVICCALDTLQNIGLEEAFLEIGSASLIESALDGADLDEAQKKKLSYLIDSKSMVDLQEYLCSLGLSERVSEFFLVLPFLGGQADCLEEALSLCFNERMRQEIQRLMRLERKLEKLGYKNRVMFDLGKIPHLDYYTGLIFEGYMPGVAHSILSGGRYDDLLAAFGQNLPACGFSFKLDHLIDHFILKNQKTILLEYPPQKEIEAFLLAKELRVHHAVVLKRKEGIDDLKIIEKTE